MSLHKIRIIIQKIVLVDSIRDIPLWNYWHNISFFVTKLYVNIKETMKKVIYCGFDNSNTNPFVKVTSSEIKIYVPEKYPCSSINNILCHKHRDVSWLCISRSFRIIVVFFQSKNQRLIETLLTILYFIFWLKEIMMYIINKPIKYFYCRYCS